jgi:hypothetical protein
LLDIDVIDFNGIASGIAYSAIAIDHSSGTAQ